MRTEYEINQENALKLSQLILDNPNTRVIAWINSMDISDEYCMWCGNIGAPEKTFIAYSEIDGRYVEKDGDAYEDYWSYYGGETDDWDDETLERKASEIPWEEVIAVYVSTI